MCKQRIAGNSGDTERVGPDHLIKRGFYVRPRNALDRPPTHTPDLLAHTFFQIVTETIFKQDTYKYVFLSRLAAFMKCCIFYSHFNKFCVKKMYFIPADILFFLTVYFMVLTMHIIH